jgi:hypothetical protein
MPPRKTVSGYFPLGKENSFMNRKQNFEKHYSRLRFEAWLLSLLWGLVLGLGCGSLTALILWFTKLDGLILSLIATAAVTLIATLVCYALRFRPDAVKNARRLDRLGLEERLVTMVEFEKDDSVMARMQREDAKAHLEKIKPSSIRMKLTKALALHLTVTAIIYALLLTLTILSASGIIPGGDELIEDAVEEAQEVYVSVTYEVEDGGYIEGEADQLILLGSNAEPVVAVAEEGYIFVEWDDGRSSPDRADTKVTEDVVYIAVFEPISEDGDEGEEGNDEKPMDNPQENENASQSQPNDDSDSPSSAGGKYEEANQIIDGETYYREVLEMYKELLRQRLETEGDTLTEEERAIIEAYLGIV